MSSDFNIIIKRNPADGFDNDDVVMKIAPSLKTWKHTIKDVGGNWIGDGAFDPEKFTPSQMREFFLTMLGTRIIVIQGGIDWWEGQIVNLEYTTRGQTFRRTLEELANRTKIIYTKIGPQLFINGDVETAAWTTVSTPSTIETTTDWFAKGTTAMHIVSDAASEGAQVEDSGTPAAITITAGRAYVISMVVEVIAGTWTLQVQDTATGDVIAQRSTGGTGREWLQCQIADDNSITSVRVRILSSDASEEIFADAAIFRTAPVRSETRWWEDADSINAYGRIEGVFLTGEKMDDEADGDARRELAERAWAVTLPPDRGSSSGQLSIGQQQPDQLTLSALGMVWTLKWRHALTDGEDNAASQIKALLDESQFIASSNGIFDRTNAASALIQSSTPITLWDGIEKAVEVGSGSGVPWTGGVYPGRVFQYEPRSPCLLYEHRNGVMRYYRGAVVDPLDFRPGYCLMSDMPQEPTPAGASAVDDPRRVWLSETAFVVSGGEAHVEWSREKDG